MSVDDDPYAHEARQEALAEQKALHRPLRAWYVDARNAALRAEHGPFPGFWQDLATWAGWRAVRKAYLRHQDTGEWPRATGAPAEQQQQQQQHPGAQPSKVSETAADGEASSKEDNGTGRRENNNSSSQTAAGTEETTTPPSQQQQQQGATTTTDAEMIRELFEPMRAWYASSAQASLRDARGAFPATADLLASWPAFREVTGRFLDAPPEVVVVQGSSSSAPDDAAGDNSRPRKRNRFGDATGNKRAATSLTTANGGGPAHVATNQLVVATPHALALGTSPAAALGLQQQQLPLTHEQRQELAVLQMKLRTVQERTVNFAAEFDKWMRDPERPASPPPIYGPDGKRANTAEVRFRQALERERSDLLKAMRALRPEAARALGDDPPKPTRKLYIPVKEYPNVCFMGLILGPRGNHHKRMEKDSGCRIRIRGKGSLREGSRGKDTTRDAEDEKDDLHVYIEGPTEEAVRAAAEMVEPLLNPESRAVDELKEKHQLELAEINGTTRHDEYCHICGEKGHRQWECPAKQRSYAMANVRCAICGDTSHPTRDCALYRQNGSAAGADGAAAAASALGGGVDATRRAVDSQFLDFMSELGEDPGLGFRKPGATVAVSRPAPTLQSVHPEPPRSTTTTTTTTTAPPPPNAPGHAAAADSGTLLRPPGTTTATTRGAAAAPTTSTTGVPPSSSSRLAPTLQSVHPPPPAAPPAAETQTLVNPRPIQFAAHQPSGAPRPTAQYPAGAQWHAAAYYQQQAHAAYYAAYYGQHAAAAAYAHQQHYAGYAHPPGMPGAQAAHPGAPPPGMPPHMQQYPPQAAAAGYPGYAVPRPP